MELISAGKTARSEIESILEMNIGGHLDRLENSYGIISRSKPINAKINSRKLKFSIIDNFLNFWFRFLYKNRSSIELKNFDYIKQIIKRDYNTYAGIILERYYRERLTLTAEYNRIGTYWESGNQNEIDIVAINETEKKILVGEVKYNSSRLNIEVLKNKAVNLLKEFDDYKVEYKGFSLEK